VSVQALLLLYRDGCCSAGWQRPPHHCR
jgi:hypothetical protein